nr:MAG TPA: hypothetical protein [Caudoviricetes sp.]
MIGVYITINGTTIYARSAVNRLREKGAYVCDDGAVALAIKMLETIEDEPDKLSLCKNCWCMTRNVDGVCGKCKAVKDGE